jgi:hypothetical protein
MNRLAYHVLIVASLLCPAAVTRATDSRAVFPSGTKPNPDANKPLKHTGRAGGVDVKTDVFLKI